MAAELAATGSRGKPVGETPVQWTVMGQHGRVVLHPRALHTLAGIVAGLSGLAVVHALTMLRDDGPSAVLSPLLLVAATIGFLALSAGVGALSRRSPAIAVTIFMLSGLLAGAVVWTRPRAVLVDLIPVVAGTIASMLILALLCVLLTSPEPRHQADRSRRRFLVTAGVVAGGAVAIGVASQVAGTSRRSARMAAPAPGRPVVAEAPRSSHRFIQGISANGRYFTDQHGEPILVRGDSPWAILVDLSPAEVDAWCSARSSQGFNAAIVSLLGHTDNGGPENDGRTYDGIPPFLDDDITQFNEAYWTRVDSYLGKLAAAGITVFLYPSDGWVTKTGEALGVLGERSMEDLTRYGEQVGTRYKEYPNIMWMLGGDYMWEWWDSNLDDDFDAVRTGVRSARDMRPWSIQLGWDESTSQDSPHWDARVDWDFVYTYFVTYTETLTAYASTPVRPSLFAEGAYEGSSHDGSPTTTPLYLRKMVGWALTSGSPGEFYGCEGVWDFQEGWQDLLFSETVSHVSAMREAVRALPRWWDLVPDTRSALVTAGRGTPVTAEDSEVFPSGNDYVTAARTPDGSLALIYMPAAATVTVDMTQMGANPTALWIDPTSGRTTVDRVGSRYTSPGRNAYGDDDWFLVLQADRNPGPAGS